MSYLYLSLIAAIIFLSTFLVIGYQIIETVHNTNNTDKKTFTYFETFLYNLE